MSDILNSFWEARDNLEYARQIFNMAEPAYIDSAIFSLNAAEAKFKQILSELRLNEQDTKTEEGRLTRINKLIQEIIGE